MRPVSLHGRPGHNSRALGRSAKRLHFMHFLVIDDGDILSATGEYIGVFDADDYVLETDAVARQVAMFDSDPSIGMVYTAFDQVDEYSQQFRACRPFAHDYVRDGLVRNFPNLWVPRPYDWQQTSPSPVGESKADS